MNFENDQRIVLTLDAGGTNFVFSAIQGNHEIVEPLTLPSNAHDLGRCLSTIVDGFSRVQTSLPNKAAAISFAFPGPADYPNGIIGDLGNLPAFRGGVALGPMLQDKFKLPVFINNDGDLYAYGEALAGFLPHINGLLEKSGSPKRFNNLVGLTLGTGFGGGIVRNGQLFIGDNSGAGEVWLLRNKLYPGMNAEEGVSIRAAQRFYAEFAGIDFKDAPSPKDIHDIAQGKQSGNRDAAIQAWQRLAEILGDALANVLTVIDGLAVIGGGLAGASDVFMPFIIEEMRASYTNFTGQTYGRLAQQVFNLEDKSNLDLFLKGDRKTIRVPDSDREVAYDPMARVGIGISKIGTSKAVALGAYAFALNAID
jgi:glucokinase